MFVPVAAGSEAGADLWFSRYLQPVGKREGLLRLLRNLRRVYWLALVGRKVRARVADHGPWALLAVGAVTSHVDTAVRLREVHWLELVGRKMSEMVYKGPEWTRFGCEGRGHGCAWPSGYPEAANSWLDHYMMVRTAAAVHIQARAPPQCTAWPFAPRPRRLSGLTSWWVNKPQHRYCVPNPVSHLAQTPALLTQNPVSAEAHATWQAQQALGVLCLLRLAWPSLSTRGTWWRRRRAWRRWRGGRRWAGAAEELPDRVPGGPRGGHGASGVRGC